MSRSTLAVFSEANDFRAALKDTGYGGLVVNSDGTFRAQLTRITLDGMELAAGEERQPRVAFIVVPPRSVRVTLPLSGGTSLICSGGPILPSEIVTHSAGYRFHERTNGPCRWNTMSVLTRDLATAGHVMGGSRFALPAGERRWRPGPGALRLLTGLHRNAVHATAGHPSLPVNDQAAHGLEQQLIGALVECLTVEATDSGCPARRQQTETMARFEDLIATAPAAAPSLREISASLGVSATTLRSCCHAHLGMSPSRYRYLRRMQLVQRALRDADHREASVAAIAKSYGFDSRGSFPRAFRLLFGELPSVTLRRAATQGV